MKDSITRGLATSAWPGTLVGVLGGMGPEATASFIHELTAATPADSDQGHIPSLTLCLPQIPDRTDALLHDGPDPVPLIRGGLEQLVEWGATILAVPCNTAHIFIDRFTEPLGATLVHIVQAVLDQAQEVAPGGAWMTGTEGTLRSGLYQDAAAARRYPVELPDIVTQRLSNKAIAQVKAGQLDDAGATYRTLAERLWQQRDIPILTACTELPIAYEHSGLPAERQVSSLGALARAVVREAVRQREQGLSGLSGPADGGTALKGA